MEFEVPNTFRESYDLESSAAHDRLDRSDAEDPYRARKAKPKGKVKAGPKEAPAAADDVVEEDNLEEELMQV